MSSISVYELKNILNEYPNDYKVIMNIKKYNKDNPSEPLKSIAYINGVGADDNFREVRLMN